MRSSNTPRKIRASRSRHEGLGTFAHFVAASLENAASIKLTHVESGTAVQSIQALNEKKIDVSSQALAGIAAPAREGKVRILGVAGERRSPAFPDVPTFTEQGIPVAMDIWRGIGAPKGTPQARIAKLEAAFEQASKDPSFLEASKKYGFAIRYMNSSEFGKFIDEDDKKLSGVLDRVGLKKGLRSSSKSLRFDRNETARCGKVKAHLVALPTSSTKQW